MSEMFDNPASASGISWEDLKGSLLVVTVAGLEEVDTTFGRKPAVRGDVLVVDGELSGEVYDDALVFPKALVSQLRPKIGGRVLGRLGQGQAKAGQKPPWLLTEPTEADTKAALAALKAAGTPVKAAARSSADDDEPPF